MAGRTETNQYQTLDITSFEGSSGVCSWANQESIKVGGPGGIEKNFKSVSVSRLTLTPLALPPELLLLELYR